MSSQPSWGEICGTMLNPPTEQDRNVALWRVCTDVVKHLDDYRPKSFPVRPAVLVGIPTDNLAKLIEKRRGKAEREDGKEEQRSEGVATQWSEFRDGVTFIEGENAKRLYQLARVAVVLGRFRTMVPDPSVVERMEMKLASFVADFWRTDLRTTGDLRTWSARVTVRFDLLPISWRYL